MLTTENTFSHLLAEAVWAGLDQAGTLARYRRILQAFAEWYERQYGIPLTSDAFTDQAQANDAFARYELHCAARLSKSSMRRVNAALRIFAGALMRPRPVDDPPSCAASQESKS